MKRKNLLILTMFLITLLSFSAYGNTTSPSPKNSVGTAYGTQAVSWIQTEQGWTCYRIKENQQFINRWVDIRTREGDGKKRISSWYYFDEGGIMQTGWLFWENDWYYLQEDGIAMVDVGFVEIDGDTYYIGRDGTVCRNDTIIKDGKTYKFDDRGKLIGSVVNVVNKAEENDQNTPQMNQLDYLNSFRKEKGISPLIHDPDFDRVAQKVYNKAIANGGNMSISEVAAIAEEDGRDVIHIAFIFPMTSERSNYLHFSVEAIEKVLRNLWYTRVGYYKQDGRMMLILAAYSGESATVQSPEEAQGRWVMDQNKWKYKRTDDTYAMSCWVKNPRDGKWYHFDESGYLQTGWFTDTDGKIYYLNPATGEMMKDTTVEGKTLNTDGTLQA